MQKGAEEAGKANNVSITTAAGKEDGDEATQIQAIEAATARGDSGILITPATDGVNPAIQAARDAGLYVIALDTPPNPADVVDITFATDNFKAGELIGKWAAGR
jgi:fructose transport system substrate-binding protein